MKKQSQNKMNEINQKNIMTKKIGAWCRNLFFLFLLFFVVCLWGFLGFTDNFIPFGDDVRSIVKWIALVLAIITGLMTLLVFVSFRNAKKDVLQLINETKKNSGKSK